MWVRGVHIKHFRVFDDFWFVPNRGVNVIIGPNNIGKTALLDAMSLCLDPSVRHYRDDVVTRYDFHDQDLSQQICIRVWLAVEDDETDDVKLAYLDKVSKWTVATDPPHLAPLQVDPMTEPEELDEHKELVCVEVTAQWDDARHVAEVEHHVVDEAFTARGDLSYADRDLLDYRHFGSQREPLRELSLRQRSALSRNLDESDLSTAFRELLESLESNSDILSQAPSLRDMLVRLKSLLAPEMLPGWAEVGREFAATFLEEGFSSIRRGATIATVSGESEEAKLPLSCQGHGVQNALLLAYLIDGLRSPETSSIVVLEEPEQNLEPPLARWIFRELYEAGRPVDGTNKEDEVTSGQAFVTTHSPVLVTEADGAECLVIMQESESGVGSSGEAGEGDDDSPSAQARKRSIRALTCSELDQEVRKTLELNAHLYATALFARQVLIVEGASEAGFLPVAFRHLAQSPAGNPFHLGLEIVSAGGKGQPLKHAKTLMSCGKMCHVLLDWDGPNDTGMGEAGEAAAFVTSWPGEQLLPFLSRSDLEAVLVAGVPIEVLFAAVKEAYEDAGHELQPDNWRMARCLVEEPQRSALPQEFPDLRDWSLDELPDEHTKQAFLYAALHGPHSCKSVKDMRIIGQMLAAHDALPELLEQLRARIVASMIRPQDVENVCAYLAPGQQPSSC